MLKSMINKHKVLLVVIGALIFRLALTSVVFHPDIVVQASWGWWIKHFGLKGFYDNNVWPFDWPTQPPLMSALYGAGFYLHEWLNTALTTITTFIALHRLAPTHFLWFFNFVSWFGGKLYGLSGYRYGEIISIKIMSILADVALGVVIYQLGQKIAGKKISLAFLALYLFSPFSWYESALWGQVDQLSCLFLLASFLLLEKYSVLSPLLFLASVNLKPTALIFFPLFLWAAVRNKKELMKVTLGTLLALFLYYLLVKSMSNQNFIAFNLGLKEKMFAKGEFWTWVNTFNFWRVVTGYLTPFTKTFLRISYTIWGYLLFGLSYFLALVVSWKRDLKNTLTAMFIVAYSGWLFLVTMHERYLFPAVVLGLILCFYERKLFKYWVVMSLIFMINLYNGWWFPSWLNFLREILVWQGGQDGLVPKVLSAVNVILFLRMTFILVPGKAFRHKFLSQRFFSRFA